MIFKWLFTFLAILWLYQTVKPWFSVPQKQTPPPPSQKPELPVNDPVLPPAKEKKPDKGDYIDYEEIE